MKAFVVLSQETIQTLEQFYPNEQLSDQIAHCAADLQHYRTVVEEMLEIDN